MFTVGPLELEISDPFGLSARRHPLAAATQLTVYPAVDRIVPLPHTHGHDPHAGADHPTALGFSGDDFYALRAYEMGDDLRRVHWPSTARLDDIMIKQLEMPWQGRATVLVDNRRGPHTAASFELAVSHVAVRQKRRDSLSCDLGCPCTTTFLPFQIPPGPGISSGVRKPYSLP